MSDILTLKTPASWHKDMWREGLPCGNGNIGALVYGHIEEETIVINHYNLWHWGLRSPLPDVSHGLRETRDLLNRKKFNEANWIISNLLNKSGYEAKLASPCQLCDIKLFLKNPGNFKNYKRRVDMESAEISVQWDEDSTTYKRRLFVSRDEDILACKISSSKRKMALEILLQLHETYDKDTEKMREEVKDSLEIFAKENYIFYAATNDDGEDFGAILKVNNYDGTLRIIHDKNILIEDSKEITVYCKFFKAKDRKSEFKRLKEELDNLKDNYEFYLEKHKNLHKKLYNSANLKLSYDDNNTSNEELLLEAFQKDMSNELIEKLWKFGRYLMICGTNSNGLPFPLYGLWGGRYRLMWSHNMANENIQMIYWHTLVGGLDYTLNGFIDYFVGLMDDFKKNAKQIFGLSGIYIPAGTTPGMGYPNQVVPVIINWIGASGWIAQHFYDYYKFSKDEITLKEKILPFMYEVFKFYRDFIIEDNDENLKIFPSVSPENTPMNLVGDDESKDHPCTTTINSTMDIAIIKEFLKNFIDISDELKVYQSEVEECKKLYKKLPKYSKNSDKSIREWIDYQFDDRNNHRHVSHIYPIFPGREFIKGRDDAEIINSFKKSVDKRILGSQTGWSLAHMASINARFEEGEKSLELLNILARSCLLNNFFTVHNDWRPMGLSMNRKQSVPVQLDANMGFVNAIQEMLLFVSSDYIKILPACPKQFCKGEVTNFRIHSGTIDLKWDITSKSLSCIIKAKRKTKVKLQLPKFINSVIYHARDKMINTDKRVLDIELESKEHIEIKNYNM